MTFLYQSFDNMILFPLEFFNKLVRWSREFGDIYLIWVGLRPFIFLYKVEAVQPLLSSSTHIEKSLEYQYLKPWLGTGLVTSGGKCVIYNDNDLELSNYKCNMDIQ